MERKSSHLTSWKFARHAPQKLSGAQVDEIRRRFVAGETDKALATEFKVSSGYVRVLANMAHVRPHRPAG